MPHSAQPLARLYRALDQLASPERYLFTPADLRALAPELSDQAYRALLTRANREQRLQQVCRGLYLYHPARPVPGLVLFHAAARLRAQAFNYISLETALSDCGVISQVPMNWITVMSSARSNIVNCGPWGTIEFINTRQRAAALAEQLAYDARCHLWRASPALALRDMRMARRNLELIDWSIADELV
ncbi:type IV toxin-antitoxin system AbiEi family antitoxin [Pseudomonas sp. NPDC007930]|uniref:type IV toxin-antitoxin system AbiEi family antitoxin n=1 Tax=Pseudomonas sp. NPDC007930 TaxID=3364417 RepID=UPI0036E7285B